VIERSVSIETNEGLKTIIEKEEDHSEMVAVNRHLKFDEAGDDSKELSESAMKGVEFAEATGVDDMFRSKRTAPPAPIGKSISESGMMVVEQLSELDAGDDMFRSSRGLPPLRSMSKSLSKSRIAAVKQFVRSTGIRALFSPSRDRRLR
jgi:hypothetical protein